MESYDPDGCQALLAAIVRQWWRDAQQNGAVLGSFIAFTGVDRERLALYARRPLPKVIGPEVRATAVRCPGCFGQFTPMRSNQRYCSDGCRVTAHRRRRYEASGSDRAAAGGDGG